MPREKAAKFPSPELVQAFLREVQHGVLPDPRELCDRLQIRLEPGAGTGGDMAMKLSSLVMCSNKHGDTPFLTAGRHGQLRVLERLRGEFGVPLEHTNSDWKTALHEAAQAGHLECVLYLIGVGAHVDSLKKADWTPLMLACTKESVAIVEALVSSGASLSLVNKDGWTPFHIACREGHSDVVKFLLDASPGCWDTRSKNGRTPLHTAALHGKLEAVRILLDRCSYNADSADSCGVTPLMDSVRGDHMDMAEFLLHQFKATLVLEDALGRQALHHASQAGASAATELLITEGASVNAKATETGLTALHYAAKEGHADTLSQLLSSGADLSLTDKMGRTALDVARHARDSQAAVAVLVGSLVANTDVQKASQDGHCGSQNHASEASSLTMCTVYRLSPPQDFRAELERDMRIAFTSRPKRIPSKYHYDKVGSNLFEEITELPEYYLTRAEAEILEKRAKDIMKLVVPDELVELGSGSSTKTRLLIEAMHSTGGNRYAPIDISESALRQAAETLSTDYKWLEVDGNVGDYHTDLPLLQRKGRRLLAFLGSSLGNYTGKVRRDILAQMSMALAPGDALLMGVDLVKDVETLVRAYNDATGVTARFNFNVLEMINRELDANFLVQEFKHVPSWNPEISGIESWLRAQRDMTVTLRALNLEISLVAGEGIMTEMSCKFTQEGITRELVAAGLKMVAWYTDSAKQFGLLVACRA